MPFVHAQNTVRAFLAVNPPVPVLAGIESTYGHLLKPSTLKRPKPGQFHITVTFLGKTPRKKIPEILKKLEALRETRAFNVSLQGIGMFYPHVIWIGTDNGKEELQRLHENACHALNIRVEKFHAHLTLARNKHLSPKAFKETVESLSKKEFKQSFQVKGISLMESTLTRTGSTYKECAFIPFMQPLEER